MENSTNHLGLIAILWYTENHNLWSSVYNDAVHRKQIFLLLERNINLTTSKLIEIWLLAQQFLHANIFMPISKPT